MAEKIRLNKFISESGICSRREADKYIEQGHVMVNGKRAGIGDMVSSRDKVMVNGRLIEARKDDEFVFLAFNKPTGIVTTTEHGVKDSIIDYIGYHERIFPIGRLDKDSQGLIFLTNNGDIVNKILRAGNKHEKEYVVTVNKPITDEFVERMSNGVPILGEVTKKCIVSKEAVFTFRITLIQGLNRQIRRMCEYFGYEVIKLERVRIMNITLKGLPLGEWRMLDEQEMKELMMAIADSSSDAAVPPSKGSPMPARPKTNSGSSKPSGRKPDAKPNPTKNTERSSHFNPKAKELRGSSGSSKSSSGKGGRGGNSGNRSQRNSGRR